MKKTFLNIGLGAFMLLGFTGCQEDDDVKLSHNPELYAEATLDGKTLLLPEGKDNYKSMALSEKSNLATGCLEQQTLVLAKAGEIRKSLGVTLQKTLPTCAADCSELNRMFETGDYSYAGEQEQGIEGVVVFYVDINGKLWSTNLGNADQTGSTFEIVELEEYVDAGSKLRTKATFNCKLYDGEGNVITVTDGVINSRSLMCS